MHVGQIFDPNFTAFDLTSCCYNVKAGLTHLHSTVFIGCYYKEYDRIYHLNINAHGGLDFKI